MKITIDEKRNITIYDVGFTAFSKKTVNISYLMPYEFEFNKCQFRMDKIQYIKKKIKKRFYI